MLTLSRRTALIVLPLLLAVVTAVVVVAIAGHYRDPAVRWTAIGAVFTAAALLVALVGLPIALFQLFAVQQDLSRLALVPPGHLDQLKGLLIGCHQAVNRQVVMTFDTADHSHLFHDAFFAHFPDLSSTIGNWDAAVENVTAARDAFAAALEKIADEEDVGDLYEREAILNRLQERDRPSLHLLLENWPAEVPVEATTNRVIVAGQQTELRWATDQWGAEIPRTTEEIKEAMTPLIRLCERARGLPVVKAVADTQDILTDLIPPTRNALTLWNVTETFPVDSQCPICQRNLGLA